MDPRNGAVQGSICMWQFLIYMSLMFMHVQKNTAATPFSRNHRHRSSLQTVATFELVMYLSWQARSSNVREREKQHNLLWKDNRHFSKKKQILYIQFSFFRCFHVIGILLVMKTAFSQSNGSILVPSKVEA